MKKTIITLTAILMLSTTAYARNSVCIVPPEGAPPAIGTYCPAVLDNEGKLTTSLFVPLDVNGKLIEGGFEAQSRRVIEIMDLYLAAVGMTADDIQEVTIVVRDLANFAIFNRVYTEYFQDKEITTLPVRRPWGAVPPAGADVALFFEARGM